MDTEDMIGLLGGQLYATAEQGMEQGLSASETAFVLMTVAEIVAREGLGSRHAAVDFMRTATNIIAFEGTAIGAIGVPALARARRRGTPGPKV